MELVTAAEMRALDAAAIQERKIPSLRLMKNAGRAVVEEMERRYGPLRGKAVAVVCGKGQNGGDGFVAARLLRQRGCTVRVAVLAPLSSLKDDAATTLREYRRSGGRCISLRPGSESALLSPLLRASDLVVDAIFGTGLNAPVEGMAASVIDLINAAVRPTVAIDLPSGLDADTGSILGTAVHAEVTVTLGRPKRGLYLGSGPNVAGKIRVADIGIPEDLAAEAKIPVTLLDDPGIRPLFSRRPRTAHKGTYGHAGIIAGSVGKTGAAAMAALGALRVGAGLVTVAVPRSVNGVLEAKLLEAMTFPVAETETLTLSRQARDALVGFAAEKTAVAIGPGLGRHPEINGLIADLLEAIRRPMVLDADGINALAGQPQLLRRAQAPLILTPHPGEMGRLLGMNATDVQKDRLGMASRVAQDHGVFVVLKGAATVIAGPDGAVAVNPTGNPGMATGGTGDVLTGMIVGLLAQGLSPWNAACAGVYVHGLAGDLAASIHGEQGMIARDVIAAIPKAIRSVQSAPSSSRL
jgi:ADP-dependent NAD(P)H-hydrate dehydratase / NAD(P)H-hydrate epimerase